MVAESGAPVTAFGGKTGFQKSGFSLVTPNLAAIFRLPSGCTSTW